MFVGQRSRWDLLPSIMFLSQFQNSPGPLHFEGIKHIARYIRANPDVPLVFKRRQKSIKKEEKVAGIEVSFEELDSDSIKECMTYSVEATRDTKECLIAGIHDDDINVDFNIPLDQLDEQVGEINIIAALEKLFAPYTEGGIDAKFYGGLVEHASIMGGWIGINGTAIICISIKNNVPAYNATDAEINTVFYIGKVVLWIRQIMEDLGIPYNGPIHIAEDNRATQLADNSGKISKRTRHIATQQAALQTFTRAEQVFYYLVKGTENPSDHLTKLLGLQGVSKHAGYLMGLRFLTKEHNELTKLRNQSK